MGASVADIKEAIADVRTMRSLRGLLSSNDIADIANFLKRNGAGSGNGSGSGSNGDSDDDSDEDSSDDSDRDSDENSTDHVKGRSRDDAAISGTPGATGVRTNPFNVKVASAGGLDGVLLLFVAAWGLSARARRGRESA